MHVKLAGRFKLSVMGATGEVTKDTGWFSNLITNQGLDWLGASPTGGGTDTYGGTNTWGFAFVGTGNTPPAFTDTTMQANVTPAALVSSSNGHYQSGTPPYYSFITTYQWAQGAIVGNLSEVGVGNLANQNPPYTGTPILFSHALIVDGSGNPTTLSVTSTDTLTVTYESRLYINTTDTNYSLVINGVTYSGIYRPAQITTAWYIPVLIPSTDGGRYPLVQYFSGAIGPTTGQPSGPGPSGNPAQISWTFGTYTNGTYTIQCTGNIPANSQGAINVTAIQLTTTLGSWQFSVSPSWNRLATQNISTTWALSWGRY